MSQNGTNALRKSSFRRVVGHRARMPKDHHPGQLWHQMDQMRCRKITTSASLAPNGPTWDEHLTKMLFLKRSWTPVQVWHQMDQNGTNVLRQGCLRRVLGHRARIPKNYRKLGTNFEEFWDTVTPYWDAEQLPPGPMDQNGVNTLREGCF